MVDLKFSQTPLWEKVVGSIGCALIVLTIGYLFWTAITNSDTPPVIEFEVTQIEKLADGYLVNVMVRNQGQRAVTRLNVEARLEGSEETLEQSTTSIDYLAAKSRQEVGFYFTENLERHELVFQALNYQKP